MNYIYDIYANLNKKYYDIYEWDKKDKILHIKKIPIFKISTNALKNMIKNEVKIDTTFIELFNNKTEFFHNSPKVCLCAFTDSRDEIIVQLSKNGNIIKKSSIHFTDKYDNMKVLKSLTLTEINYTVINILPSDCLSRKDDEKKNFLIKSIDALNKQKLAYLYFECFNQKKDDDKLIKNIIKNEINNNNEFILTTTYNFLKLIYQS